MKLQSKNRLYRTLFNQVKSLQMKPELFQNRFANTKPHLSRNYVKTTLLECATDYESDEELVPIEEFKYFIA